LLPIRLLFGYPANNIAMKKLHFSLLLLTLLGTAVQAQVTTAPVGFNSVTALDNSDTRFSLPLQRPSGYQGLVQSVTGSAITVQGLPGWTANQFIYASGAQTNTYYVSIGSGNKVGMFYTVTANSADTGTTNTTTVTVDTAGDTLTGASGIISGDSLSIIPFWTFGTLFPSGQGVFPASSVTGSGNLTQILIVSPSSVGTNLSATSTYYYYPGNGTNFLAGWRKVGGGFNNLKDDDILLPESPIIIRQNGVGSNTAITATGTVPLSSRSYIIGTFENGTAQDNWVSIEIPVALTLAQSNLAQSAAFTSATSVTGSGGDQLLVFDDTTAGFNKSAGATYYYYPGNGSNFLAGWRKVGGGFNTLFDTTAVFQPGSGYVIRKQATTTASTSVWTVPLTY
jgi:uncharacterized protein (TIGR02597 family)